MSQKNYRQETNNRPHWRRALFIGVALIGLAACAGNGGDETPSRPSALAAESAGGSGRPAMWRLADPDTEVTLFGTFHILPAGVEWSSAKYDAAMAAAETTIIETDATSPEAQAAIQDAVGKFGLNPPGVTLSETLGPDRAAQLTARAEELGVPMAALEPMRPWLALISLTQVVFQRAGFDPAEGVEAAVLARAAEEGDAIAYLETAVYQIEALASLDGEDMFANFDTTIDQFAEFDELTARLLEAWRTGDVEGIERDILAPLREVSPGAYGTLFTRRNENWAQEIEALMAGEGDYFIAVGAGHLVGPDSVVAMLRDRGYAVERVQ